MDVNKAIMDLFIVSLYIIFNWLLHRTRNSKRFKIYTELFLKLFLPISIATGWYILNESYFIFLIILAGLALLYLFNYSEFELMRKYQSLGRKLVVLNFQGEEPIPNDLVVYYDSSDSTIDTGDQIEKNLSRCTDDEKKKYRKLIEGLKEFKLSTFFLNLCDFIGDDFVRYARVYYLRIKKKDEDINKIPKVLILNCTVLQPETVDGLNFRVIAGIEAENRDDVLLSHLKRLSFALENVKVLPKWYEIDIFKEENEALRDTIKEILTKQEHFKNFKRGINTRLNRLLQETKEKKKE